MFFVFLALRVFCCCCSRALVVAVALHLFRLERDSSIAMHADIDTKNLCVRLSSISMRKVCGEIRFDVPGLIRLWFSMNSVPESTMRVLRGIKSQRRIIQLRRGRLFSAVCRAELLKALERKKERTKHPMLQTNLNMQFISHVNIAHMRAFVTMHVDIM